MAIKNRIKRCCWFLFGALIVTTRSIACDVSETLSVEARQHLWVVIKQYQVDWQVQLSSGSGERSVHNDPTGRTGNDYLFLSAGESPEEYRLCITAVSGASYVDLPEVSSTDITAHAKSLKGVLSDLQKASGYWQQERYRTDAIALWQRAANALSAPSQRRWKNYALFNVASAMEQEHRYEEAISALASIDTDEHYAWRVKWFEGRILRRQRYFLKADMSLSSAFKLSEGDADAWLDKAEIASELADTKLKLGEVDVAKQLLDSALDAAKGSAYVTAHVYDNLGLYYLTLANSQVGQAKQALLAKAVEVEQFAGVAIAEAGAVYKRIEVNTNIANIYERMHNLRAAQAYYRDALKLAEQHSFPEHQATLYKNLAKIAQLLGNYPHSVNLYRRSSALYTDISPVLSAVTRCEEGTGLRHLQKIRHAIDAHEQCFESVLALEDLRYASWASYLLAEDYLSEGNIQHAKKWLSQSFSLSKDLLEVDQLTSRLALLATIEAGDGKSDHALLTIQKALEKSVSARYPSTFIAMNIDAASIALDSGKLALARQYANTARNLATALGSQLDSRFLGPRWRHKTEKLYQILIAIELTRLRNTDKSVSIESLFSVVEQSRLNYKLQREKAPSARSVARLRRYSELADRQAAEKTANVDVNAWLSHHLFLLNAPVAKLANKKPVTLASLRRMLGKGDMVVYFIEIKDTLYRLSITRTNAGVENVGDAKKIYQIADVFMKWAASPNARRDESLHALADVLSPVEDNANAIERFFIVNGPLSQLPYQALRSLRTSDTFTDNMTFINIASATQFFRDTNITHKASPFTLSLFAAPVLDSTVTQNTRPSWTTSLASLPSTQKEADIIKQILHETSLFTYEGTMANRRTFLTQETKSSTILHIASHAFSNADVFDNVGFALSPFSADGNTEPGYVTGWDVEKRNFDNELVVISGCDTAQGEMLKGSGALSLASSFLKSGARNVVSTLWPVSDNASAQFMSHFYQHLLRTHDIPASLVAAQSALRSSPRYRHPFYWAAYVHAANHVSALKLTALTRQQKG